MNKAQRTYHKWVAQQIKILKNAKQEIKDSRPPDFSNLPFKISLPLSENPSEPEYVVQYLTKQKIDKSGLWMETGVWHGEMITRVAKNNPDKTIYGFDSFQGFPEDGRKPGDWNFPKFNLQGNVPTTTIHGEIIPSNARLVKGWFKDTLPPFLKKQNKKISFISVDCDLYSSTKDVLQSIQPYITNETVICFDDAWHYDGFLDHQIKALYEFVNEFGYEIKWICSRGDMFDFSKLEERSGERWNWRNQFRWRATRNYSDCAFYLIK